MTILGKIIGATALVFQLNAALVQATGLERTQESVIPSSAGLITGLTGTPLRGMINGETRSLVLGDTVSVSEELRTGQDSSLEILWGRHTLILIQPQSTVLLHESRTGQTEVVLRDGSVRLALAYGGRPADMATVLTPSSRVFTRGGILEVDVSPPSSSVFSHVASVFSHPGTPGEPRSETVRVLEGESGIEPLTSTGHSDMLEAGVQARIASGQIQQVGTLPRHFAKGWGLPDTDRRQGTPAPLTKLIANVHVNHALEVERQLNAQGSGVDRAEITAQGPDLKGAVVSTSLGVPAIPLVQPGPASGPVAPATPTPATSPLPTLPPMQPGTSNGPVTPTTPPPATSPLPALPLTQPGATHGPVDHTPPSNVTSPLPTLPPVQVPTTATLAPNQSGGNNNHHLLRDFLNDEDKSGRRHKLKESHTDHDKGHGGHAH